MQKVIIYTLEAAVTAGLIYFNLQLYRVPVTTLTIAANIVSALVLYALWSITLNYYKK